MARRKYNRRRGKKPLTHRQVKAVSKIANKQIHKNAECKVLDGSMTTGFVDSVGGTYGPLQQTLPIPARGLLDGNRIGDEIMVKSIQMRGFLDCKQFDNNLARVLVVQDLEDDASDLLHTHVLETSGATDDGLVSFYKRKGARGYKVLSDLSFRWDSNNASAPKPWCCNLSYKDLKLRKIKVDAAGNNVGAIRIFVFGGEGTTGPLAFEMARFRMKYYDM